MSISRRAFFGASGAVVAATALPIDADAVVHSAPAIARTSLDDRSPVPAPEPVARDFLELLAWLADAGWAHFLWKQTGFDLTSARREGDEELLRPLAPGVFEGFAGIRAVQPGDPAMSMLYHALASADVVPTDLAGKPIGIDAYPSPEQIDLLENYIHARAEMPSGSNLEMAMFAYEYRPAAKTPHGRHADMVFSRTGIARTGTHHSVYDRRHRTYVTGGEIEGASASVTPARYGLFLARRQRSDQATRIGINSQDAHHDFLIPLAKLFDGCAALNGRRLDFAEAHRDEKLRRLMSFVSAPPDARFNTDMPPFTRRSASRSRTGSGIALPGHDTTLVTITAMAGSVRVTPTPQPLVAEARQGGQRCGFVVPKATGGPVSNRRYSTLRLLQKPWRQIIDFALSDLVFRGGRYTTGFRSPRNGPVFANIRHRIECDGRLRHIGNTREELGVVANGGYVAQMFVDGLCDGCVVAVLGEPERDDTSSTPTWLGRRPLAAFSIVAAPDFFPRLDPIDLESKDGYFLEGGSETASGGRLPANPHIPWPGDECEIAFPASRSDRIAMTIAAAVSAAPDLASPQTGPADRRTVSINTLPDTVSFVFAPGWDVTYAAEEDGAPYYATFGLGSPFPEDMKLCAAANGMWAGSSPDATRTFFPDLEPFPFLGRPATAVPLLDDELGHHPDSPAVLDHGASDRPGWDGEFGPFVVLDTAATGSAFTINYASMALSDYVLNARRERIDLDRLAGLSADDVRARMTALNMCIRRLPGRDKVRSTELWLVSAELVADWSTGAAGKGLPKSLGAHGADGRIGAARDIAGQGWLYVFAKRRGKSIDARQPGRCCQPCDRFYIAQVTSGQVRYASLDPRRLGTPQWL